MDIWASNKPSVIVIALEFERNKNVPMSKGATERRAIASRLTL